MINNKEYRQQLLEIIYEKIQELKHRQNRLNDNILAGTCHKSLLAQRKVIFNLQLQIDSLEYKYQHNL